MFKEFSIAKTTYLSLLSNLILFCIKLLAGVCGNSYALIADAIETSGDILSSVLVIFGLKYAQKPADKNHPFGHGKIEPLITFIVVAFMILSAGLIFYESILNIITPHNAPKPWTLIILSLIIIWKESSYRFILFQSKKKNSDVLKAEAWHHRSDAITSIFAFLGITIAVVFGKGFETADDWAALLSTGFIFYNSYLILRPAFSEVMDEHIYDDLVHEIKQLAIKIQGVEGTEKCYIRKAGTQYHIELHILLNGDMPLKKAHDISHCLKDYLKENIPQLGHVVIHKEPNIFYST